jgi:peptidoglycan hydrolase-like protein with peptidoglycan-binding domain
VSFTYNCGPGNLKRLVEGRTIAQIADAMLSFNHAGGKELAGLTRRRKAERELFIKRNVKIVIGSARIDERGKATGGAAGDQKQKSIPDYSGEVSLQDFYISSKGWYVLRPKDPEIGQKIAEAMRRACNNEKIGYSQSARLEIIKAGTGTLKPCNCDCSSLVRQCIIEASGKDPGNFTTTNEALYLVASGLFEDKKDYTSNMNLFIGDVLVTKKKGHTVVVVEGNSKINLAKNDNIVSDQKRGNKMTITVPTIKLGSTGKAVNIWQAIIGVDVTGEFDTVTLAMTKSYQKANGLDVDGIVGKNTWNAGFKGL